MSLGIDGGAEEVTFQAGDVLFKQEDPCEFLYIIKSGEVCSFTADKGQIVPIFMSGPEELVGDEASTHLDSYHVNAVATEETVAVKVPAADIKSYLSSTPKWINNIVNLLAEKLVETSHIISEHKIRDGQLTRGQDLAPEKLQMLTKSIKAE